MLHQLKIKNKIKRKKSNKKCVKGCMRKIKDAPERHKSKYVKWIG